MRRRPQSGDPFESVRDVLARGKKKAPAEAGAKLGKLIKDFSRR
jgi:hypothetical protein